MRLLPALALIAALGPGARALGAAAPLAAPTLSVDLALPDARPLTVGDHAVVTIEVASSGAVAPRFPAWAKSWGEAEVVSATPVERAAGPGGATLWRQKITVAAFKLGRVPLPPVAVTVPDGDAGRGRRLQTPQGLALTVGSVIAGDPRKAQPEPPAMPRSLPWGKRFWWTFSAMAALAAALGAWVFARKRAALAAAAVLPPLEELERELARIAAEIEKGSGLETAGRTAAALSGALRRYLGRSLGFPALESTTTEIQRRLRIRQAPDGVARSSVELLRGLDRVKFSPRRRGDRSETAEKAYFTGAIDAARSIAGDLERHLHPVPVVTDPPGAQPTEPLAPRRAGALR